jgi:catechol 2,3-dioxygenase-like lactoylglutathione lyase family enzyme
MKRVLEMPEGKGTDSVSYACTFPAFWIDRFHPHGAKQHTPFIAASRAQVDAFHATGLTAGGKDNGAPGLRDPAAGFPPGYYAAFVIDPDGNNMEAVFRER